MGNPDGRRLRDRQGAAEYLGVSGPTLDRLIQTGQLPIVKLPVERTVSGRGRIGVNRRILIDTRDLDALIDRSKEASASTPASRPVDLVRRTGR